MKRLIINADDYGRSPDISRGIRQAHLHGIVTSTTCMMNIPTTAADVVQAVRETPNLGMGVHLVLTMGRPILPPQQVPTIVDADGNHFKYEPFLDNLPRMNIEHVKAEWRAQIEAFIQASGRKPDHLDSHHHFSYITPELFHAMLELAVEYGCPIRNPISRGENPTAGMPGMAAPMAVEVPRMMKEFNVRGPDALFVDFYDEGATRDVMLGIFDRIKDGQTCELMCHPGYVDKAFAKESVYNFQRAGELEVVTDPSMRHALEARGIQRISFADL